MTSRTEKWIMTVLSCMCLMLLVCITNNVFTS